MGWVAKATAVFMGLMSLWSVGVIIERLVVFSRGSRQSYRFVLLLREYLERRRYKEAIESAKTYRRSPIARLIGGALTQYLSCLEAVKTKGPDEIGDFDVLEAVDRSIERIKDRESANLRKGLGGLATIASAAPFVGLFGTVVGIINAFRKLSGGGGLDVVGPGISEALVSTAFGLLVAIPAAMFFNYFVGRVEFFVVDMNDISSEFVDYIVREGRPREGAASSAGGA
ncbi:MAG: MotA/TolQ/ExbB proton channel family protein [Pseudomonadota bacterium]